MRSKLVVVIGIAGLLLINFSSAAPIVQAGSACQAASGAFPPLLPPLSLSVSSGQTLIFTVSAVSTSGPTSVTLSGTFVSQPFALSGAASATFTGTAPADGVFDVSIEVIPVDAVMYWNYSLTGDCWINIFNDGRINPEPQASIVGYCVDNHDIETYLPNGRKLFTVTVGQIKSALTRATSHKRHVLIKQEAGQQLWALKSNELQFHNALGEKYDFIFPADRC